MFEPKFGRDIAAFGVVSIEMEFFGIPTRSPVDLQAFVVDRFVETAALIFVNLEAGTNDGVAFFLINQFCFVFFSCHFVYFRGLKF